MGYCYDLSSLLLLSPLLLLLLLLREQPQLASITSSTANSSP
jgi:hypothetical protein